MVICLTVPHSKASNLLLLLLIIIITKEHSCSGLAWSRPRAHHGLSRPTSVFRIIIIGMYKFYPARLRFGSTRAKTCFGVKQRTAKQLSTYAEVTVA